MELMKEQKQMVFSGNDPNLPGWFTTCINGLAKKELTLLLEDTWVDISGNPGSRNRDRRSPSSNADAA